MADVWLATGEDGARVALKRLRNPSVGRRHRFAQEVRLLDRLRHPGITALVDHGEHEGVPWLATRFVDGPDLRQYAERLRGRPPSERATRSRHLALRLCETLDWLHRQGWVHRDLKPANVILDEAGEPILIDFGVATATDPGQGDDVPVPPGALVGSAAWASPEQLRGEPVDGRADQYGLGGVLYFLLTGQRPFPGESSTALIQAHLHAPVPPPSLVDPTVPADLESFVLRLLAKHPADRFPDMAAAREQVAVASGDDAGTPLAGRQPALDGVAAALRQVASGEPAVLRVRGPRGSGRGWLARTARDVAMRRGLACVVADEPGALAAALARVERGEAILVVTSRELPPGAPPPTEQHLPALTLADLRRSLFAVAPRTEDLAGVAERLQRASGGNAGLFLALVDRYRVDAEVRLPSGTLDIPLERWLDGMDLDEIEVAGALAVQTSPATVAALSAIAQVPAETVLPALADRGLAISTEAGWRLAAEAFRGPLRELVPDLDALRDRADRVLPPAPTTPTIEAVARERALAEAAVSAGHLGAALEALDAATRATEPFPHWHAELSVQLALLRLHAGQIAPALADTRRAVVAVEGSFDPRRRCGVLLGAARAQLAVGQYAAAAAWAGDAAALARAAGDQEARFEAAVLRARILLDERPQHRTAAAAAVDRVADLWATANDRPIAVRVALDVVSMHIAAVLGDRERVRRLAASTDAALRRLGRVDRLVHTLAVGRALLAAGDATGARACAESVGPEARSVGFSLLAWEARRLEARACGEPIPGLGALADGLDDAERSGLDGR